MSCLSICEKCKGWQWTPGPQYMDALLKLKLEQLKEFKAQLAAEGKTFEQWQAEQPPVKPYEWPPLREGECGCGRT